MRKTMLSTTTGAVLAASVLFLTACAPPRERTSAGEAYWTPKDPPPAAYALDVTVKAEGENMSLAASGTIFFTNTSGRPLNVLAFEWTVTPSGNSPRPSPRRPLSVLNRDKDVPLKTPLLLELPEPLRPL